MDVEQALRSIQAGVDELDARIDALEEQRQDFVLTTQQAVDHRRDIVARMRHEGLSVLRISRALAIPTGTIWNDLRTLGLHKPDRVIGADDRQYDVTRCNGNGLGQATSR